MKYGVAVSITRSATIPFQAYLLRRKALSLLWKIPFYHTSTLPFSPSTFKQIFLGTVNFHLLFRSKGILGNPLNRAIYDEDSGEMIEIMAGDFLIVYVPSTSENYESLHLNSAENMR